MQKIQGKLMAEYGVFIRGSIVKGNLYTNKNFLFGNGLISAYEIENELAVYPRIIVEYGLVKEVIELVEAYFEFENVPPPEIINERNFCYLFREAIFGKDILDTEYTSRNIALRKDEDNEYYVDFLKELLDVKGNNSVHKIDIYQEIDSMPEFNLVLLAYCKVVFKALIDNSENRHVLIKYLWCCSYINQFCLENDIEPPFTFESIQYNSNINLKNAKYKELKAYLKI
jgi:hypothetical protein